MTIFLIFFKARYQPRRVIVAAAGNFRHDDWCEEMAARLGQVSDRGTAENGTLEGERTPEMGSGVYPHSKDLEQAHLCLGVAGISQAHPQRYPAYVLNTLLGGGMSSRLFQEIREKRGKAYSVYSFSSSYKDVGYFGVYAGTSVESTEEVVELILAELKKLAGGRHQRRRTEPYPGPTGGQYDAGLGVHRFMDEPYGAQ